MKKNIEIEIAGSKLKIDIHRWAKQSNGSAVLTYNDNVMLITANMKGEEKERKDFFPLLVDFRESNYAAGKIPGGFFKREGKPSEREILLSRLIDRPIRPLFPENFLNETQVVGMLISADFSIDYDSMGIIGASAALLSSTIPFTTPLGAVKIGWKDGEFSINPGLEKVDDFDMLIQVAGTEKDIVMLEARGNEFEEELLEQGIKMAKDIISKICIAQKKLINPDKLIVEEDDELVNIYDSLKIKYEKSLNEAIFSKIREERKMKISSILDEIMENEEDEKIGKYKIAFDKLQYQYQ